ncbi:SURF1 family protein [Glaciimonas soli]|uniref:SURF1-like protein n=1 Tax=Glaciimonas soli TaxID=2590999 RepID=A0A843YPS7_9BURK|nr:SURF1 family protein [Glaciimonas soli]MQQ99301.1 SURF1 family protein [Glaciimonas soli]
MTLTSRSKATSVQSQADSKPQDITPRSRSATVKVILLICAGLLFAAFFALGTWQVKRLQWKLDLIERVDQRVHAAPVPAPGPERWPQIGPEADEYRHVSVTGNFLYPLTTQVQAVTDLGSGFWVITPLRSADGNVVLINRGFIPAKLNAQSNHSDSAAVVTITGLLRMSEPGGGFLRHNDPAGNRWYSRDVQAIAAAHGLQHVAPYFIDVDAAKATTEGQGAAISSDTPIGGLTVIAFHNNHLVYAVTWYALALMVAAACFWVAREERKMRRRNTDAGTIADDGDENSKDK